MGENIVELFKDNGYIDVFEQNNSDIIEGLSIIKESTDRISRIYTNNQYNELYFIIDARECVDPSELCEEIDNRICWFINFGCKNKITAYNLKYNIVQILLYTQKAIKKSIEESLDVSRKITIKCSYDDCNWESYEAYKLPFYIPSSDNIRFSKQARNLFSDSLPDMKKYGFLYEKNNPDKKTTINKNTDKAIKEWLNYDNI